MSDWSILASGFLNYYARGLRFKYIIIFFFLGQKF